MNKNKEIKFYKEWLPLPKDQFRILFHLARFGSFSGNLSDLCRYFSLNPQTKNRNNVRNAIDALTASGMIDCAKDGRTYNLKLIPKEKEIHLPCAWVDALTGKPLSASISSEALIKVFLWLLDNGTAVFTNADLAAALNISTTTIVIAKKVLAEDFEAIIREYVTTKVEEGVYRREGQIVNVSAWLKEN